MALALGMAAFILADVIVTDNAVYGYRESSATSILSMLDFTKWERLFGAEPPYVVDFKAWEDRKRFGSWEDVDFEAWERRVYGNNLNFWDWQREKYGDVRTDLRSGRPPDDYWTRQAAWGAIARVSGAPGKIRELGEFIRAPSTTRIFQTGGFHRLWAADTG